MLPPSDQRSPRLSVKTVALVGADDAGARAGNVPEHRLDHFETDTKPL
jgi:hypothetical protein